MRRTAIAGAFSLALTLGGCAAKQPVPPPLKLVTEDGSRSGGASSANSAADP